MGYFKKPLTSDGVLVRINPNSKLKTISVSGHEFTKNPTRIYVFTLAMKTHPELQYTAFTDDPANAEWHTNKPTEPTLDDMKIAQLVDFAEFNGITITAKKRADILAEIKAALEHGAEE